MEHTHYPIVILTSLKHKRNIVEGQCIRIRLFYNALTCLEQFQPLTKLSKQIQDNELSHITKKKKTTKQSSNRGLIDINHHAHKAPTKTPFPSYQIPSHEQTSKPFLFLFLEKEPTSKLRQIQNFRDLIHISSKEM